MEKRWQIALGLVVLASLSIAYYLISPAFIVVEMNEALPSTDSAGISISQPVLGSNATEMVVTNILAQGEFMPGDHDVAGKAILLESEGEKILRFEDFDTINGPDLLIYLSKDLTAKDFVNIGGIKATKGNVNYEVDSSIDTSQYKNVLVWCRAFGVLFSYAELK